MTPAVILVLIMWIGCIVVGYHLDKYKGQSGAELALTIMLGLLGPLILAFILPSHPVNFKRAYGHPWYEYLDGYLLPPTPLRAVRVPRSRQQICGWN